MQTKKSLGPAGIKQSATFLKKEPVAILQQAKGLGESMTGSGIDAKQHASGNGAGAGIERQVALHMTQPMIGSLTIHCASTTDAVTDIGNKVEEALLAILESANAIH